MSDDEKQKHHSHRKRQAGRKADKKRQKSGGEQSVAKHNPKAFAVQHVNKTARAVRRTLDVETRKQHIPLVEQQPVEPPPVVVALVGPRGSGKSLLLRCLVRHFCQQRLNNAAGPVTVVSGKKKRLTFIECNTDINCLIDVAKVADLVLMLIDARKGLDMLLFEFINICQVHGFPKMMAVLTHMDGFKDSKKLKKMKKRLKHRLWTELYNGAKLFYLTRLMHDEYLRNEVHNLGRFISVMKFRPLVWRSAHPYVLVDRLEDISDPELVKHNSKCDRRVSLYGYIRGANMLPEQLVHIPGCADVNIAASVMLPDPCPLPEQQKKRSLNLEERKLFAPMCGVGDFLQDKDGGTYVRTRAGGGGKKQTAAENVLEEASVTWQVERQDVQLFTERETAALEKEVEEKEDVEEDMEGEAEDMEGEVEDMEEEVEDTEEEVEEDMEEESAPPLKKQRLDEEFVDLWGGISPSSGLGLNWNRLVYGSSVANESKTEDAEDEDEFFRPVGSVLRRSANHQEDFTVDGKDWLLLRSVEEGEEVAGVLRDALRNCFVTGAWDEDEDAEQLLQKDDALRQQDGTESEEDSEEPEVQEDEELEDAEEKEKVRKPVLSKAEKLRLAREKNLAKKAKMKAMFDAEIEAAKVAGESSSAGAGGTQFYDEWKAKNAEVAQRNRDHFAYMDEEARIKLEGYRVGIYVKMEFEDMPCELVRHFDPSYPIIVGGLQPGEEQPGFVHTRFKHHRWYKRVLKCQDPLIISLGWRRFQTLPVFSVEEHNGRHRFLKYTPEHDHCNATFFGPPVPANTGLLAVQSVAPPGRDFRVAGSGVVLDKNQDFRILKKLKLVGEPYLIKKKTCFIKGMFNSELEVARFVGARLQTVSGLRGAVKKAVRPGGPQDSGGAGPPGSFRSTFEDKLLASDIVFCRCWAPVKVPAYFNPVVTLLLPAQRRLEGWKGMRTQAEVRREKDIPLPQHPSGYEKVERQPHVSLPLHVPAALQRQLPYKFKETVCKQVEDPVQASRPAVVAAPHEGARLRFMNMVRETAAASRSAARERMRKRAASHRLQEKKKEAVRTAKRKRDLKRKFALRGMREKNVE